MKTFEERTIILNDRIEVLENLLTEIKKKESKAGILRGDNGLCDFVPGIQPSFIFGNILREHFKNKKLFFKPYSNERLRLSKGDDPSFLFYWKGGNYKSRLAFVKKMIKKYKTELANLNKRYVFITN